MIGDYLLRKAVMADELFMDQLDGVACLTSGTAFAMTYLIRRSMEASM
jgi:hypothetical protein